MRVNFENHDNCTGCGLCFKICPTGAIEMVEDVFGFVYANVNSNTCIDCGNCSRVCSIIKKNLVEPKLCFAAARKSEKKMQSSSGGLFAILAEEILINGGIVCGCQLSSSMKAKHVCITSIDQLDNLLGSKYVQSSIVEIFDEVRDYIKHQRKVLFCGTPCQVAAIKEFIGNSKYLFTIELICHGVPSNKMFIDYISFVLKRKKAAIPVKYIFRDKKQGWTFNGKLIYKNKNGVERYLKIPHRFSSYMTFFLNCDTYRNSCYTCPYATQNRGADITIGDFWGVNKMCKAITKMVDINKGISCCLINTEKGKQLFKQPKDLVSIQVDYCNIRAGNEPLNNPSKASENRRKVMTLYENEGWSSVQALFDGTNKLKKILFRFYNFLPVHFQQSLRNFRDK
ncbi:MAG: Coenzyme F420 hydrogenase/dehydrogenase, beta subunit C-terminal domain [Pleomorphochaeta sp.]